MHGIINSDEICHTKYLNLFTHHDAYHIWVILRLIVFHLFHNSYKFSYLFFFKFYPGFFLPYLFAFFSILVDKNGGGQQGGENLQLN